MSQPVNMSDSNYPLEIGLPQGRGVCVCARACADCARVCVCTVCSHRHAWLMSQELQKEKPALAVLLTTNWPTLQYISHYSDSRPSLSSDGIVFIQERGLIWRLRYTTIFRKHICYAQFNDCVVTQRQRKSFHNDWNLFWHQDVESCYELLKYKIHCSKFGTTQSNLENNIVP